MGQLAVGDERPSGASAMGGRTTDQLASELDDGYGVVAQETADARF